LFSRACAILPAYSKTATFAFTAVVITLFFIAVFFLIPQTRGILPERMKRCSTVNRITARRNMLRRTSSGVLGTINDKENI
jgi:hypothetical protein